MTICKFYELECVCREGGIGVWLFLGAPSIHRMYGFSFARHGHGRVVHAHWRTQSGIVKA